MLIKQTKKGILSIVNKLNSNGIITITRSIVNYRTKENKGTFKRPYENVSGLNQSTILRNNLNRKRILKLKDIKNPKLNNVNSNSFNKSISSVKFFNELCNIKDLGSTGIIGMGAQSFGYGSAFSINYNYLYHFNRTNQYKIYKLLNNLINILNHFFATFYAIISKPVFLFTQNKLTIYINYYIPKVYSKLINRHN